MKLWGGRFKKGTDKLVNDFNSSINVDSRMYKEDIEGSLAHASMLGNQNIIPKEASDKITSGLLEILNEWIMELSKLMKLLKIFTVLLKEL